MVLHSLCDVNDEPVYYHPSTHQVRIVKMKLQHLLVACLLQGAFSNLVGPGSPLSQQLDLDISNSSSPTANLFSVNTSKPVNDSLVAVNFLPYRFRVPDTRIVLRLGFGIIRHRINMQKLYDLLYLAQEKVQRGITEYGADEVYPVGAFERQHFSQFRYGLNFWIDDSRSFPGAYFTWGELHDVVKGLRLYLAEGRRNYETKFAFWNEGRFPGRKEPLGNGRISTVMNSGNAEERR